VDGTGSGSCPIAGCGNSGVESSGSATRSLVYISNNSNNNTVHQFGSWVANG
jgi:hypothetical protein